MKVVDLSAFRREIASDVRQSFGRVFSRLLAEEESFLLKSADLRLYEPDEVIVREGTEIGGIFVVEKGSVRVIRQSRGDSRFEITHLGRLDVFGEMAFLDDAPASASVVAETEVQALFISEDMIRALLRGDPTFGRRFYHSLALTLAARLRLTTQWHIDFQPRAEEDRRSWDERRRAEGLGPDGTERRASERRSMADRRLDVIGNGNGAPPEKKS